MNKRSAILVAAGLVVSLATGFVAFLNGALGPAADTVTRPIPVISKAAHTASSADGSKRASGAALADRRAADHDD